MPADPPWTPDEVGRRLVAAFKRLPGHPVMSRGRAPGFDDDAGEVLPFGWPARFLPELRDRNIVLTWASCTARGESVRERYAGLGWSRSTAERRRAGALATIAAGLNAAGAPPCGPG